MDHIKLLLESTGLSADDLIKKLAEYKMLSASQTYEVENTENKTDPSILTDSEKVVNVDLDCNSDNNVDRNINLVTTNCDIRINNTDNVDSTEILNTNSAKLNIPNTRLKVENTTSTKCKNDNHDNTNIKTLSDKQFSDEIDGELNSCSTDLEIETKSMIVHESSDENYNKVSDKSEYRETLQSCHHSIDKFSSKNGNVANNSEKNHLLNFVNHDDKEDLTQVIENVTNIEFIKVGETIPNNEKVTENSGVCSKSITNIHEDEFPKKIRKVQNIENSKIEDENLQNIDNKEYSIEIEESTKNHQIESINFTMIQEIVQNIEKGTFMQVKEILEKNLSIDDKEKFNIDKNIKVDDLEVFEENIEVNNKNMEDIQGSTEIVKNSTIQEINVNKDVESLTNYVSRYIVDSNIMKHDIQNINKNDVIETGKLVEDKDLSKNIVDIENIKSIHNSIEIEEKSTIQINDNVVNICDKIFSKENGYDILDSTEINDELEDQKIDKKEHLSAIKENGQGNSVKKKLQNLGDSEDFKIINDCVQYIKENSFGINDCNKNYYKIGVSKKIEDIQNTEISTEIEDKSEIKCNKDITILEISGIMEDKEFFPEIETNIQNVDNNTDKTIKIQINLNAEDSMGFKENSNKECLAESIQNVDNMKPKDITKNIPSIEKIEDSMVIVEESKTSPNTKNCENATLSKEMLVVAGTSAENKRQPIYGSIRKSVNTTKEKKIYRCSKPWMLPAHQKSDEDMLTSDEETHTFKTPDSTRAEIFNQLQKLRCKIKPSEGPLGNIINPISKMYTKRICRPIPQVVEIKEVPDNKFGIKILQVRGGIKEEEFDFLKNQKLNKYAIPIKEAFIKLSKTNDLKKIKGWKNKKFLGLPEVKSKIENTDSTEINQEVKVPNEPIASCSYTHPDFKVPKIEENKMEENKIIENISAFASNNLDGFLEEQKKLDPTIIMFDDINIAELATPAVLNEPKPEIIHNTRFGYGNKRRHYTLATHEDADCMNQNIRSDALKPRTLAEKRKLLEAKNTDIIPTNEPIVPKSETLSLEESLPKNFFTSTICYRSKKFKVNSYYKRKPYRIEYTKRNEFRMPLSRIKPSILNANLNIPKNKEDTIIKYRAGPLSRKLSLQTGPSKQWFTVLKKLPKVYLDLKPELGKIVHPQIRKFLNLNTYDISKERANFALSALVSNKNRKHTFKIPYAHHQEQLLLRKKVDEVSKASPNMVDRSGETEDSISSTVSNVLDDIITCLENREIADELIQEDSDLEAEEKVEETNKIRFSKLSKAERQALTKTDLIRERNIATINELKRLSVKIIEVNIDDENESTQACLKLHCRLGCVCKSLKSGVPLSEDHCNETRCIFKCICGYEKSKNDRKKFTVGTELISDRTVLRLQDNAKKHLAKVEAEFTQTVIQSYDKSIVVGDLTERKKRIARVPKKYEDYLDARVEHETIPEVEEIKDPSYVSILTGPQLPVTPENFPPRPCSIYLRNHDFSNIVPFCLEHNLYECHCQFKAKYTNEFKTGSLALYQQELQKIVEHPIKRNAPKPTRYEMGMNEKDSTCARTKGTAAQYYIVRNKTIPFKKKISKKLGLEGEKSPILQKWITVPPTVKSSQPDIIEIEDDNDPLLKPMGIGSVFSNKPNRRKQKLHVRGDNEIPNKKMRLIQEKAIQRRKFKNRIDKSENRIDTSVALIKLIMESRVPTIPKSVEEINRSNEAISTKTNMYTPTNSISNKFAELLGQGSSKDSHFRLLQWSALMARYLTKLIEIWCISSNNKMKLLITDKAMNDMHGYTNIRVFENVTDKPNIPIDVIRWIVCRKIPEGKNGEDILVILNMSNVICEICGICAKNKPATSDRPVSISLLRDSIMKTNEMMRQEGPNKKKKTKTKDRIEIMKSEIENMRNKIESIKNKQPILIQEPIKAEQVMATIEPVHKIQEKTKELINVANNKYKTVQQVAFARGDFTTKLLSPLEFESEDIEVALPNALITCKWRVLAVNSNFSILSFNRNQFRIKCSDIITVMKVSVKYNKTIIINTDDISLNYKHTLFGIYLVPNYQDRIFIGPYYIGENHDIETLRFVNNVLVNTELFNKMRGNPTNRSTGIWYQQTATVPSKFSVIDLTGNEDDMNKTNDERIQMQTISPRSVLKSNVIKSMNFENKIPPFKIDKGTPPPLKTEKFIDGIIRMMKDNCTPLPRGCHPVCFSVNFDKLIIHGYRETMSECIHVFWPGNINYQFSRPFQNFVDAIIWLEEQLSNSLICIPATFKIKVNVLNEESCANSKFFTQWISLTNKYFLDIYAVGIFGGISLAALVEFVTKHDSIVMRQPYYFKALADAHPIHSPALFKLAISHFFLKKREAQKEYADFLELIRIQIEHEKFRKNRLAEAQIEMKAKNLTLLQKHTSLIKKVDPKVREQIKNEFMKSYDIAIPTTNKNTNSNDDDVICLDSDDDGSDAADQNQSNAKSEGDISDSGDSGDEDVNVSKRQLEESDDEWEPFNKKNEKIKRYKKNNSDLKITSKETSPPSIVLKEVKNCIPYTKIYKVKMEEDVDVNSITPPPPNFMSNQYPTNLLPIQTDILDISNVGNTTSTIVLKPFPINSATTVYDNKMNLILTQVNRPIMPKLKNMSTDTTEKITSPPNPPKLPRILQKNMYKFKNLSQKFFIEQKQKELNMKEFNKTAEKIRVIDPNSQAASPIPKKKKRLVKLLYGIPKDDGSKSVLNLDLSHVDMKEVMGILGDPSGGEQITLTKQQLHKLKSLKKT